MRSTSAQSADMPRSCKRVSDVHVTFLNVFQGGNTNGEVERDMIEDLHEAIFELVELIKTYRSKNRLSKVLTSMLFNRRQDKMGAVVDRAILRLHVSRMKCSFPVAISRNP